MNLASANFPRFFGGFGPAQGRWRVMAALAGGAGGNCAVTEPAGRVVPGAEMAKNLLDRPQPVEQRALGLPTV
jgi:hypothetical protein